MKRITTVLMLAMLVIIASCEKETVLTIDLTDLSYTDAGGSQTITLIANKPWSISASQSWCKVSPSGGEDAAGSRISISCDANTTYDARSCTVTITCAEMMKTISISQATNNGLMLSQTSYEVTKAAQQLNIQVQANVKFSVDVDNGCKDWVKYNTTKGLTTSTVVLDIAENKTYDSREGKVTIKQDGGTLLSTVTIKQSQLDGLFLTTSEYILSNEKHTLTVEVSTNVEFDVKSEADWVKYVQTKGLGTKQIVLEVAENDTYDRRETTVNVKQKDGDLSGTITIKQDERLGLLLSQTEFDLNNDAQSIDVEVKSNVDYDIVIPSECKDWVKLTKTKSLDTKNCTFSISKNETYDVREGSITFKQKNGALSGTVSIRQAQTDAIIAEHENYSLSYEEQQLSINISSNVEYEVIIDEECTGWINRISTKGLKEESIVFHVAENEGEERSGKITFKGATIQATVLIKQQSGIVVFEDDLFEAYCVTNFDKNKDGKVSLKEALDVEGIDVYCGNMESLKGIECFINLKRLRCGWNNLTSLDVSHNTELTYLGCDNNKLTSLDVSNNTALQELACFSNQLTRLDVSKNLLLTHFTCGWNQLTSIDVSHNTALVEFGCDANPLKSIDVSHNTALISLACYRNGLTKLDVSHNMALQELVCFSNELTKLDVSHNSKLTRLECNDNRLARLDVGNNNALKTLKCNNNLLDILDVSDNGALSYLDCTNNPFLTQIWLVKGHSITEFHYDTNVATIYYVDKVITFEDSNFEAYCIRYFDKNGDGKVSLKEARDVESVDVYCGNMNSLKGIEWFINLKRLRCGWNNLTSLDVSHNTELTYLGCDNNKLTSLDVSHNTALQELACFSNQLTSLDVSKNLSLTHFTCGWNQLTSIDVSHNTALVEFGCDANPLKSIDVSHNTALISLACYRNGLTKLDVSHNMALQELVCFSNELTKLDVSHNSKLTKLRCNDNKLSTLDVSNNSLLISLDCTQNPKLLEIWLKNGQIISEFKYDTDIAAIKYK